MRCDGPLTRTGDTPAESEVVDYANPSIKFRLKKWILNEPWEKK